MWIKKWSIVSIACFVFSACAGPTTEKRVSGLDSCLQAGQSLTEVALVDNNLIVDHGTPTAFSVTGPGDVLIASTDGSIKQWDLANGSRVDLVPGPNGEPVSPYGEVSGVGGPTVSALAATADGGFVVAGDQTGGLRHFDQSTGRVTDGSVGSSSVSAIALSADGAQVAAAVGAAQVRVWTPGAGTLSEPLPTLLWAVSALAYLPDGRLLLAGHIYGDPAIEIRSAADPMVNDVRWTVRDSIGAVEAIAVSANGAALVGAGPSFVLTMQIADPEGTAHFFAIDPAHEPRSVAVTGEGGHAITVGLDSTVRTWDLQTGQERTYVEHPGAFAVQSHPGLAQVVIADASGHVSARACTP